MESDISTLCPPSQPEKAPRPLTPLWVALGLILLLFCLPLYKLAKFAWGSDLYSYILLIPVVSLHHIWTQRRQLNACATAPIPAPGYSPRMRGLALLAGFMAVFQIVFYGLFLRKTPMLTTVDHLAIFTVTFLFLAWGACFWFLNKALLRMLVFPLAFLAFMVPMPSYVEHAVVTMLQHGSAIAASMLFHLSGTPIVHDSTSFQLPGFSLQVAPECSGIHSTLVLFIVSTVGAYHFLRTPWKRALLCLFILPLALLRNGFRVFVIGMLCVHVSPEMIHSPIHHHGGPIFFALSLVPFLLLVIWLRRSEKKPNSEPLAPTSDPANKNSNQP